MLLVIIPMKSECSGMVCPHFSFGLIASNTVHSIRFILGTIA